MTPEEDKMMVSLDPYWTVQDRMLRVMEWGWQRLEQHYQATDYGLLLPEAKHAFDYLYGLVRDSKVPLRPLTEKEQESYDKMFPR